MTFAAPPEQVWQGLTFYEELGGRPPLHLRLLLPVPIGNAAGENPAHTASFDYFLNTAAP